MNKENYISICFAIALLFILQIVKSQTEKRVFTLNEVIQLSREQSPQAIMARHSFRSSYWQYRTHKAEFLPNLTLKSTLPDFNQSLSIIQNDSGSYNYIEDYVNKGNLNLSLTQNIGLTGGTVYMNSNLQRVDQFGDNRTTSYLTTPVGIGFTQPIRAHNEFRWEKRIEPLKYQAAQQEYLNAMEDVALRAIRYYFELARAQINLHITATNYANTDTLYRIAQGRYNIGTIAENELLQMELSFLNAGLAYNEAQIDLQAKKYQLQSFLGYNERVDIELEIPKEIPKVEIEYIKALEQAHLNNPEIVQQRINLLQAEREVAKAKAEKGLNANLFASFGLTQQSDNFYDAYVRPSNQESVRVGLELPIVDWGLGKKNYKMARSNEELVRVQVEQAQMDFEQEVFMQVMQFNLQDDQLMIAGKADTIAQKRYEVAKQRFLIGKIDVLDLNVALTEKDQAKRAYIDAMRDFWSYYYNIRRITLYDWKEDKPLSEDYDDLID